MTIINTSIQLSPSCLHRNVTGNVEASVREKFLNKCFKKWGFILEIHDVDIKSAFVSPSNTAANFDIEFTALCLKPEIGSLFQGNICLIFEQGVLVDVANVLKVLIPFDTAEGGFPSVSGLIHGYHFVDGIFEHDAEKSPLFTGKNISMKITGTRFNTSSKTFNCYGCFA